MALPTDDFLNQANSPFAPVTQKDLIKIAYALQQIQAAIPGLTGLLKADGTVPGATSQAQDFTEGVVSKNILAIDPSGNGLDIGDPSVSGIKVRTSGIDIMAPEDNLTMNGVPTFTGTIDLASATSIEVSNGAITSVA